ncbi:GNAT family N-acetyltransferase [Nostoc ellipsosporum NOK]|nr:GNAT family N-acetyltransferase [Nostoc ellipsosporum NOK]
MTILKTSELSPEITGRRTILKEVTPADARDICLLRNDPQINRYLSSSTTVSVEQQTHWIIANKARNDGFYFKILDSEQQRFCGTASIYNVLNGEADFGRYVCTQPVQAVETEYLLMEYAFNTMQLNKLFCRTAEENRRVWRQHVTLGFKETGQEILPGKELLIKVQELTRDEFLQHDYSFLERLLDRF